MSRVWKQARFSYALVSSMSAKFIRLEPAEGRQAMGRFGMSNQISRRGFVGAAAVAGVAAVAGLAGCAGGNDSKKGPKPVILVTSFGTSYNDSRQITIGAIESDIREAFPDYDVRRAFTAQIIIDKLKSRDGRTIDNIDDALQKCIDDGVKQIAVQPTHLMAGKEYTDVQSSLDKVKDKFDKTALGRPLLDTDDDYEAVIKSIVDATKSYDDGHTAICFMGHGTDADSNSDYAKLQDKLTADGYKQYFITTVEATPNFDDTIKLMKDAGYKKAVVRPLMIVAGDHANNDMAGEDDPDSLVSKCKAAGITPTPVIEGLGQLIAIDELFVQHTQAAIDQLGK